MCVCNIYTYTYIVAKKYSFFLKKNRFGAHKTFIPVLGLGHLILYVYILYIHICICVYICTGSGFFFQGFSVGYLRT
jgi:hypothetical protein